MKQLENESLFLLLRGDAPLDSASKYLEVGGRYYEVEKDDWGRFGIHRRSLDTQLPLAVKGYVESVAFSCCLNPQLGRALESGVYQDGDAEGELDGAELKIRGKSLTSVRALYRKIRETEIQPELSWDTSDEKRAGGRPAREGLRVIEQFVLRFTERLNDLMGQEPIQVSDVIDEINRCVAEYKTEAGLQQKRKP